MGTACFGRYEKKDGTVSGRLQNRAEGWALARKALDYMEEFNVPPTSENYAIWSAYACDHNNELCDSIDKHIDEGRAFDQPFLDSLYEKYFSLKRLQDAVMASSGQMSKELGAVRESLRAAQRDQVDYGKTLEGASGNLNGETDPDALRQMVQTLIDATAKMQERSRNLERRLHETSSEVTQLRSNLERVREEAMTDALTGIANRKRFDEMLRKGRRDTEATGDPLCLMLCDIDHFKRFNDTWGHQTGDQIIRFVAGCMTRHADDHQTVARYGGEEFGIVLPKTKLAEASAMAEKIRKTVESKKLMRKSTNEDLGNITISMGVAQYKAGESIESLIERADTNLYKSKQEGRNRVTVEPAGGIASAA